MIDNIVAKILVSPEGGTARVSDQHDRLPESGYFVGNGPQGLVCPAGMMSRSIVLGAVVHLHTTARFVGWWTDDDRFYIEPSDWVASEVEALALARERGELAFYDIARQADIRVSPAA